MRKTLPSIEILNECFLIDAEKGLLIWKERPLEHFSCFAVFKRWSNAKPSTEAGTLDNYGYRVIRCSYGRLKAHRVIWKMHFGYEPVYEIDHIDGNKPNNPISNLRLASHQQNLCNRGANSNNSIGLKGVTFHHQTRKFKAQIKFKYKNYHLGLFSTPELAHAAYCNASIKLHGDFSNTGKH